jgi:hypothetical protein
MEGSRRLGAHSPERGNHALTDGSAATATVASKELKLRNILSVAIVASLGLSACSGGGQAVPGGSQGAPQSRSASQPVLVGFQRDASCPSKYTIGCIDLGKGKTKEELCVVYTPSAPNCDPTGLEGKWTWSEKITNLKGKKYTGIKALFKPDPGNPTYDTFKVKTVKNSHGKIKYVQDVTWCAYPSPTTSCTSGEIGIATK